MGGEQKRESVVSMSQTNSNFQSDGTDYKKEGDACVANHDVCHQQNMHD